MASTAGLHFPEAQVVVAVAEDGLAMVAAQYSVVQAIRDVNATLAWHRVVVDA